MSSGCEALIISCATSSSATIRDTSIANDPISHILVCHWPPRRAAIVMLSVLRATETESKPILLAVARSREWVRLAVLPERSISAPSRRSTSIPSTEEGVVHRLSGKLRSPNDSGPPCLHDLTRAPLSIKLDLQSDAAELIFLSRLFANAFPGVGR